ncbi:MAG: hypothetical protein ACYDBJ_05290 [Aggregatilineales bacterium]
MASTSQAVPRPPLWIRLSIVQGNLLQMAGLLIGVILLYLAAHGAASLIAIILMIVSWAVIYFCCHAFGHWLVGRLVGIRFRGYGIRGTDHPENYPPGMMRQLMSVLPFFTVMTEKNSMTKASPTAQALMFAAGETATTVCGIAVGWYAWHKNIPGGGILLIISIVWSLAATVSTTLAPKGDYAKALHALRRT